VSALREIDFGSAEGRTIDELPPQVVEAFRADPAAHFFPGGEPPEHAAGRCVRALTALAAELDGATVLATVLAIAHSTLLRLGLCQLLGIQLSRYRHVFPELRNCALTTVRLREDDCALLDLNVPIPATPVT
jgi:probable phosphoglycerate mutase